MITENGLNGLDVLKKRILMEGETPEQLWDRVATFVASMEPEEDRYRFREAYYKMMAEGSFLPNSPCLVNAGKPGGQLFACFVLPVEDHMHGILMAVHDMAMIQKSGGGTGFNFSELRPKGAAVHSTAGVASGPISFIRIFNATTEEVKQGGVRRGASIAILNAEHPDIEDFITVKNQEGQLENFNLSVGVSDAFMCAVSEDAMWDLVWNDKIYGQVKARDLWKLIVHNAWQTGDPGVLFLDTVNKNNPFPEMPIIATNPCGEQPLLPNEACVLGSINLATMYAKGSIDKEKLRYTVDYAVRFLDNLIDLNCYPLPEVEIQCKANRKIGLGVMGLADLLFQVGIPYGTQEGRDFAAMVMEIIQNEADLASGFLGRLKGSFPSIESSIYQGTNVRNATRTTVAPTGTLSMIADVSSGIEPVFGLAFTKTVIDGTPYRYCNRYFEQYIKRHYSSDQVEEILKQVIENRGSCQLCSYLSDYEKLLFLTAHEISPIAHVRMQSTIQQHVDNAVSKTVNLPNSATEQDVDEVLRAAYLTGCKGITVYRDGSKSSQPITFGTPNNECIAWPAERPSTLAGMTTKIKTGCGSLYVTINQINGRPYEMFIQTGSSGGCMAFSEEVGRLISLMLREQLPLEAIIKQLRSSVCPNFIRQAERKSDVIGKSCPDVVGKMLYEASKACLKVTVEDNQIAERITQPIDVCPECGTQLEHIEGCIKCPNPECGWSKC